MKKKTFVCVQFFCSLLQFLLIIPSDNIKHRTASINKQITTTVTAADGKLFPSVSFPRFPFTINETSVFFIQWIYNSLKWCRWMLTVLWIPKLIWRCEYSEGKLESEMLNDLMLENDELLMICFLSVYIKFIYNHFQHWMRNSQLNKCFKTSNSKKSSERNGNKREK